jgi:hypothetical protein
MGIKEDHVWHIQNLMESEPEAQVVELYVAEQLEKQNAALVKELEAVKEAGEHIVDIVDGVDVPFNLRVKLTAWDIAVKSANSLINKEG